MEKYHLNISKIKDIKNLSDVAWLLSLKKDDEVILEVDSLVSSPLLLKTILISISEEILRSHAKHRESIDYNKTPIPDFETMAIELTKITGFKFSISEI